MLPTTSPKAPTGLLKMIQQQIMERLHKGEIQFQRDSATLLKHVKLAGDMGNPALKGQLLDTLGHVYNESGYFEEAGKYWANAYRVFQALGDEANMAGVQNSLGELYYHLGQMEAAHEAYDEALKLAEKVNDTNKIMLIESNLGYLWLELGNPHQALVCFSLVVVLTADETWHHIASLVKSHTGLAEVHLVSQNYAEAWEEVNHALQLAQGRSWRLLLARVHLTQAHIAQADPNSPVSAEEYYQQARSSLHSFGNPIVVARAYSHEARYHLQQGNRLEAQRLAIKARSLFTELKLPSEMHLVDDFLKGLA